MKPGLGERLNQNLYKDDTRIWRSNQNPEKDNTRTQRKIKPEPVEGWHKNLEKD